MAITSSRRIVTPFGHKDTVALNFVRDNPALRFRRHYREGLRSRISEVLDHGDLEREAKGVLVDGVRSFPRARPKYMLRVFRQPFDTLENAFRESKIFSVLQQYLGTAHVAGSIEFIVNYLDDSRNEILLCGLQEYVTGEIFNPWGPIGPDYVRALFHAMPQQEKQAESLLEDDFVARVQSDAEDLIRRVKSMISETGRVPDMAGIGNLILTPTANLKLVDINNVSPVNFDDSVYLDDQGYPVCDKSIEVLALLEEKLLERPLDADELLWRHFLNSDRRNRATRYEKKFRRSLNNSSSG
jgi:hypothetical protein